MKEECQEPATKVTGVLVLEHVRNEIPEHIEIQRISQPREFCLLTHELK